MVFGKMVEFLILSVTLGIVGWMDWKQGKISNSMLMILVTIKIFCLFLEFWFCPETGTGPLLEGIKGFLTGGGLLLVCRMVSGGGIGAGDVKLFAVLGFWLGREDVLSAAYLTVLLAAGSGMILLIFRKIKLRQGLPLAPFVWAGVILLKI